MFRDQRRRRRSSLPTVLYVPENPLLMTPPPPPAGSNGQTDTKANATGGTAGPAGGAGATASGTTSSGTQGTSSTGASGSKTGTNKNTAGDPSRRGTGGTSGTGTIPKNTGTNTGTTQNTAANSLAGPFLQAPTPGEGFLQITPTMLQQLLASAVASSGNHREPPVPKFWETEPAAWFQVFRGHYQPRNLSQLALFNALLPLVPASAVALCRPFVGSDAPDVFDRVERLLLKRFEMSAVERGKALVECTSLGDRTPEEMLQHMRSLQPGEEEGVIFRYLFISLLPDVVREVVATMDSLDDMARTANGILQSNVAARISALTHCQDADQVAALRRTPTSSSRSFRRQPTSPRRSGSSPARSSASSLCRTHARYGEDAFKCDRPSSCPMRTITRSPGNGPAGRR